MPLTIESAKILGWMAPACTVTTDTGVATK